MEEDMEELVGEVERKIHLIFQSKWRVYHTSFYI